MKYAFLDGKGSCPVRNVHIWESGTKDAKAEGLWMLWPVDRKADNKPMGQRMQGLEEDSVFSSARLTSGPPERKQKRLTTIQKPVGNPSHSVWIQSRHSQKSAGIWRKLKEWQRDLAVGLWLNSLRNFFSSWKSHRPLMPMETQPFKYWPSLFQRRSQYC